MKKAVIFDNDGTLVFQTKEYISSTIGETLSELGVNADEKFAEDFWYGSDRDKIIENRLGINYMNFWKVFWNYDTPEERSKHTGVYDDVYALRNLRGMGIKLGVVTGALTEVANAELSKVLSKVQGLKFDSVVSNDPDAKIRQKPYPDSLLICLQDLGVKSNETIYVGNSKEDVNAAKAAKVRPVVILREPIKRFKYGKSIKVISSLHEIESII